MSDPITDPQKFVLRLQQSLDDDSFLSLSLGRPQGAEPSLDKLLARRLVLRGVEQLSLVWRHRTKDITKNLPLADAVALISMLVDSQFQHAHLVTRSHDIQLAMGKKGRWSLRIGKLAAAGGDANLAANAQGSQLHDILTAAASASFRTAALIPLCLIAIFLAIALADRMQKST